MFNFALLPSCTEQTTSGHCFITNILVIDDNLLSRDIFYKSGGSSLIANISDNKNQFLCTDFVHSITRI